MILILGRNRRIYQGIKAYAGIENMEKRKNEPVYTIEDLNRFAEFGKDNPYFGVTLDFAHFSSHNILEPELSKERNRQKGDIQ